MNNVTSSASTELMNDVIWSDTTKKDTQDNGDHKTWAAVGFTYDDDDRNTYISTGEVGREVPVELIAQRWQLPIPKLILRLSGSLDNDVSNRTEFFTREFLTRLVKVAIHSETWVIIEGGLTENVSFMETLGSAVKHAKKKEIKEIPVIAVFTLTKKDAATEMEFKRHFIEGLDFYLYLSPSQCTFIAESKKYLECFLLCNKNETMTGSAIILKGTGKNVDDIDDQDDSSTCKILDISKKVEELPIEETILKSLHDGQSFTLKNKPNKDGPLEADLKMMSLFQCVRLNQLVPAVELWGLWRLAKDNPEMSARVASEALRLKRFNFIQYLLDNGLDFYCFQDQHDDKADEMKKTKKEKKIERLVQKFCNFPGPSPEENSNKHLSEGNPKVNDPPDVALAQLFKDKIMAREYDLALLLLTKIKYPTSAALYAYGMLKALRQCSISDEEKEGLNAQMEKFQTEAIKTINRSHEESPEDVLKVLSQTVKLWGNTTCVLLALKSGNKKFLATPPCKEFQKRMWRSRSLTEDKWTCDQCQFKTDTRKYTKAKSNCPKCKLQLKEIPPSKCIRRICPPIWAKPKMVCGSCGFTGSLGKKIKTEHSCPKCNTKLTENQVKTLRYVFNPATLLAFKFTSHLLFLILYAMLLVSVLETEFRWLEWVVWSWILTGIFEQINQNFRNKLNKLWETHRLRVFDWIESFSLLLFVITWFCPRLIAYFYPENTDWMSWARVLFSIDYIGFALGLLEVCYCHKFLGPNLLMIMRMTKILLQFIIIVMIFCLAYAIASESVLYPTSQMNPKLAFYVMRKAFWAMFADFNLDEINGDSCTTDSDIYRTYEQPRCPTTAGKYYVPPLMGVYYIIVNILLFNLLIAMFNSKISAVYEKAEEVWHHQKMLLTWKYCKVIILPPPFTLLSFILYLCRGEDVGDPFTQQIQDHEDIKLQRLVMAARKKTEKEEVSTLVCNGVVLCPHKDKIAGTNTPNEKPKPKSRNDASSQTETRKSRGVKCQTIDMATLSPDNTSSDDPLPSPTPGEPAHPKDVNLFVAMEKKVVIKDNRPFTVTPRKRDERPQTIDERRYYAVRERSKHGMRWQILGLDPTTLKEQYYLQDLREKKSLPVPEN